jgi:hypothetical protein
VGFWFRHGQDKFMNDVRIFSGAIVIAEDENIFPFQ